MRRNLEKILNTGEVLYQKVVLMKSDLGQLTHGSGLLKKFGCWRGKQWFAGLEQMPYAEKRNKLSLFMLSRRKLRGVFVFFFCKKIGVIYRLLKAAEKRLARVSGWELKSYHIKWEITLIVVCTTEPLNQTALGGLWFFLSYSFMTKTWWLWNTSFNLRWSEIQMQVFRFSSEIIGSS